MERACPLRAESATAIGAVQLPHCRLAFGNRDSLTQSPLRTPRIQHHLVPEHRHPTAKHNRLYITLACALLALFCSLPKLPASGGDAAFLRSHGPRTVDDNPVPAFVLGAVEGRVGGFEKVALFREIQCGGHADAHRHGDFG